MKHLQLLFALFLVIVQIACGGSSGSNSSGSNSSGSNSGGGTVRGVNGPLTGYLWYERGNDTHRFNLETGKDEQFSNVSVTPSRDGSKYVYMRRDVQFVSALNSVCGSGYDIDELQVLDTVTRQTVSSFRTAEPISQPIRLSPDSSRLVAISNEHPCDVPFSDPPNVTVYSTSGDVLFRFRSNVIAFDFLFDNRIAFLQSNGSGNYSLYLENAAGSLQFREVSNWTFPPGTVGQRLLGLRSNHDGTKFLFELVKDESTVVTVNFRHSEIFLLDITNSALVSMFSGNEPDGSIRAAEPLFSPDGKWVLTTQDFWSGGAVLETDAFTLPPTGVSYVVPVDSQNQPLPPAVLGDNIRPVLWDTGVGTHQAIRLNPSAGQTWTPINPSDIATAPTISGTGGSSTVPAGNSGELSCTGSRVWGPFVADSGLQLYVSEPNNRPNIPGCALFWVFDPVANCSSDFLLGDNMSATVDVDGSVLFTINGDTGALALSDVNLSTLEQLPNCSVADATEDAVERLGGEVIQNSVQY